MKYSLIFFTFFSYLFTQDIEGRWIPNGFNNTMYEFVDTEPFAEAGLRYTYYCPNENGCDESYWNTLDISDAIPNPNPYSINDNILSIDTFFGNISTYELGFRCDGQVIDFYYDEDDWGEGLHSTMFKLAFDDFDNECLDPNPDDCLCTEEWDPVCGIDGNTYSNPCYAECVYVIIAYDGECLDPNPEDCLGLDENECWYAEGCEWEESDNTPGGGSCIESEANNCSDLNESNCEQTEGCQWQESDNVPGGGFCVEIQTTNCSDIAYQEACEFYGCTWNESDNLPNGGGCFEGQSGDVNLDGNNDVLDVVLTVNFVIEVLIPTEQEFSSADINYDGVLNVLDIVSIVNTILNS